MKLWMKISAICGVILVLAVSISGEIIVDKARNNRWSSELDLARVELVNLANEFDELAEQEGLAKANELSRSVIAQYLFEEMGETDAILMQRDENIVLYSNHQFTSVDYTIVGLVNEKDASFNAETEMETGLDTTEGEEHLIVGMIPANNDEYAIYLVKDLTPIYEESEVLLRNYYFTSGITILIGLLFIMVLVRKSTKHLQSLSEVANEIADGNYNKRVMIESKDEVAEVGNHMNSMAIKIEAVVQELKEQIERQKLFIGAISHEYKTPLTGMLLHMELLNSIELDAEARNRSLEHMTNQCHYLEDITRKLTQLIVIEQNLSVSEVDIAEFISELEEQVKSMLAEKQISLQIECDVKTMTFDKVLMQIALMNLINNACKATEKEGKISLRIRSKCIQVEDFGIGIEEQELERIKEPFYVVDKARNKKISGTGIGLALVNEVVSLHAGTLSIQSQVDSGTTVTIHLEDD